MFTLGQGAAIYLPTRKNQREVACELDVLTYFEKDGEGLLSRLNADLRELAGLAPKKGM